MNKYLEKIASLLKTPSMRAGVVMTDKEKNKAVRSTGAKGAAIGAIPGALAGAAKTRHLSKGKAGLAIGAAATLSGVIAGGATAAGTNKYLKRYNENKKRERQDHEFI